MIGLAMEKWDDAALRRVVDAPVERWFAGGYVLESRLHDATAPVCLVVHASGEGPWFKDWWMRRLEMYFEALDQREVCIGLRFDTLCKRFGLPRTVRAIKTRALDILLRRHPLDNRLVVLRAEVGA